MVFLCDTKLIYCIKKQLLSTDFNIINYLLFRIEAAIQTESSFTIVSTSHLSVKEIESRDGLIVDMHMYILYIYRPK
jgi:hypothetical protein